MNNRTFKNDLNFGLKNEIEILPILNNHFIDENIKNTKDIYNNSFHKYDFEGENIILELKTRRNLKNKYSTTLIPTHKMIKTNKDHYFVFKFIDKCCYIKYDLELFKSFNKRYIQDIRKDKYEEPILNFEIPVNLLNDF
jgi:hypothetical protein